MVIKIPHILLLLSDSDRIYCCYSFFSVSPKFQLLVIEILKQVYHMPKIETRMKIIVFTFHTCLAPILHMFCVQG